MKVCVIGYNPPTGPYSYGSVSVWAANGWRDNGHDVKMFDRSEMSKLPKKADLYFFVDVSEDYSQSMPSDLDGLKVFWAMDTAMPGGMERSVNIGRKMDYVFCTNAEVNGPKEFTKFGVEAMWVPYGYDKGLQQEVISYSKIAEGDLSVCMIGNPNSPERRALWEILRKKYPNNAVGTVDGRNEYVVKKGSAKICISQPTEPFNHIINLRVWNALACGKLLLCKRPVIKEHILLGLVDGVNVVYWDDFDDLIKKIDYYLDNHNEAEEIAQKGRDIGDKHLMVNQIRVIEQILYSKFYEILSK